MWEAASRCRILRSSLDRSKPGGKRDPCDFKALLRDLNLLFQRVGLGTVSLHAPLALWRERNRLSVTVSYRGRGAVMKKR
jgi:hypothetical protein